MKRTVFTTIVMLVFIILLSSCSKWNVEIVDPTKPVEGESELVITKKEEKYIKNIHSEKAETVNLTEDGFANLRSSSIAFHLLKNCKALFFSYKEGDPFEGGGVAIRVFLYDYTENKTELIEELSFSDYKDVSVYERDGKAKVIFANKNSAEILSIDTESLETEKETLEDIPGNVSATGLWAFCGRHINVRDAENYQTLYSVIETEISTEFESWSPNSEYIHVREGETEIIYSISGEKMAEIGFAERENWCAESNYFTYCEMEEDYSWKVWLVDVLNGEKKEINIDSEALLIEKDFAVIKVEEKLYLKEYSSGNIFEITEDFGEYNYYEKAVYDKENETIIAAAYEEGATRVWEVKLEWIEGAGEGTEQEQQEEQPEISEPEEEPYEARKVEKNEAESFFYSAEGYEDMAFFAGWFGARDFESNAETVDSYTLWYFMPELYKIVGEDAVDEEGFFFHVPERLGNKYLLKHFGVDYTPDENVPIFDPETDCYEMATAGGGAPYKLLSYSHPLNVGENRFSVKLLILEGQDELGKYFAVSEMVFDVMEDEDGKFLRLVSNKTSEHFRKASFEMQAQSLTRQMLQVMNKKNIDGESVEITNSLAANFAMQAAVFVNASNGFDKNSPYVGSFGKRSGHTYYLPVAEIERIAFEVFEIENFQYGFDSNFEYDSEKDEYLTGFEWGMGSGYSAKDTETAVDGNNYSVEFTLLYYGANSEGDPELMEGDRYRMNFELINGEFLRYVGFEKV